MLESNHLDFISTHAVEGYPNEVCGIVLGRCEGEVKRCVEVRRAVNLNTERAHDRYEIDPSDLLNAEKEGRERGLEVIGFYHSHPDHPDAPSEFDRERAWPCYSYLIVSVTGGERWTVRSWVLDEVTGFFEEEEIRKR